MTDIAIRGGEASAQGTGRIHYYDYRSMRPGRQVKYYEPSLLQAIAPHGEPRDIGRAAVALMVPLAAPGPMGALADRLVEARTHDPAHQPVVRVEEVDPVLRQLVDNILEIWFEASAHQATMQRAAQHPVFALLRKANTLAVERIVGRLRQDPNALWVWALGELTGEDPASGADTVSDAAHAWTTWADARGID